MFVIACYERYAQGLQFVGYWGDECVTEQGEKYLAYVDTKQEAKKYETEEYAEKATLDVHCKVWDVAKTEVVEV